MNEGVWKSFGFGFDKLSHRASWTTFADLWSVLRQRVGNKKSFTPTLKGEIFYNDLNDEGFLLRT